MLDRNVAHLAPQILEYLQNPSQPLCSVEQAEVARELIVATYAENFRKWSTPNDYQSGRHPISAHASTKCYLQSWFKHNQFPKEKLSPRTQSVFRIGGIVEVELYAMALFAGAEVTNWQQQMSIVRAGWPTNNFLDFIHKSPIDGKRRVVDAKTMASFSYERMLKQGVDDSFGYLGQMSSYIEWCLENDLVDCDEGIFLCFKKDTGHIGESVVRMDPLLIKQANASAQTIQQHTEYKVCTAPHEEDITRCEVCRGVPLVDVGGADSRRPPRPPGYEPVDVKGRWKLGLQCTYCDYKFSCWTRPHQRVQIEVTDHGLPAPQYSELPEQQITVEVERGKPVFYVRQR